MTAHGQVVFLGSNSQQIPQNGFLTTGNSDASFGNEAANRALRSVVADSLVYNLCAMPPMNNNQSFCTTVSDLFPVGFGTYIALAGDGTQIKILSDQARAALDLCRRHSTAEGLAGHLRKQGAIQNDQANYIEVMLEQFQRQGLILPLEQLLAGQSRAAEHRQSITVVSFPTADRPQQLQRALASSAPALFTHNRDLNVIVMDDSKLPSCRSEYLELLGSNGKTQQRLRYAGRPERERYIATLGHIGISPEVAKFALLGTWPTKIRTLGAARNAVLLDTVGERLLLMDDDMIYKLARHPEGTAGLRLQGHSHPRDHWFFRDRPEALRQVTWDDSCNLMREHERLLGKSLGEVAFETPTTAITTDNICTHLINDLATGGNGRIVATVSGVVGDSGAYAASPWLTLPGTSFVRLVQSETSLATALNSREMLAIAPTYTITHNGFCQGGALGIANDVPLPPFFPLARNSDGVFGILTQLMAPSAFLGHIPIAVFHDPSSQRRYRPLAEFRIAELIIALSLSVLPLHRRRSADLLRYLGGELMYLANLPAHEFFDYIAKTAAMFVRQQLWHMEEMVNRVSDAPRFWREKIWHVHGKILESCGRPDWYLPVELRKGEDLEHARQGTREVVRLSGSLFYYWSDLIEAARALRQKEIRITAQFN